MNSVANFFRNDQRGPWVAVAISFGGFHSLHYILVKLVDRLPLADEVGRRRRLVLYLLSLIHATGGAAWSWYQCCKCGWSFNWHPDDQSGKLMKAKQDERKGVKGADVKRAELESLMQRRPDRFDGRDCPTRGTYYVLAISLGYFLNDMARSAPNWRAHPDELLHHSLALMLFGTLIHKRMGAAVFPSGFILETSTVVLNIMWVLKELGRDDTVVYGALRPLFATLFFGLRVFWLRRWINLLIGIPWVSSNSKLRYILELVYLLQLFWAVKIIQSSGVGELLDVATKKRILWYILTRFNFKFLPKI